MCLHIERGWVCGKGQIVTWLEWNKEVCSQSSKKLCMQCAKSPEGTYSRVKTARNLYSKQSCDVPVINQPATPWKGVLLWSHWGWLSHFLCSPNCKKTKFVQMFSRLAKCIQGKAHHNAWFHSNGPHRPTGTVGRAKWQMGIFQVLQDLWHFLTATLIIYNT